MTERDLKMASLAMPEDAAAIAHLVNVAYEVERFFVAGDRTSVEEITRLIATDRFLVMRESESIVGCVHLEVHPPLARFGMLAVDPAEQRRGIGRRLIETAEIVARHEGCDVIKIAVVDLRTDLLATYNRLGYRTAGTAPYEHRPVIRPCHFVLMEKSL
jgi:GNAT superfamily N-acetyltransferase